VVRRYGIEIVELAMGTTPWVKANAVMSAIEATDAEIVVMADADVWTDGLEEAIIEVELGAAWAVPHLHVHRLSRKGTQAVLGGADWRKQPLEQGPYPGVVGGGYVVARRQVFLDVPLDPRFVGWGQEDECHGLALRALHGQPWRGTADLVHLFHPPQERLSRVRGNKGGWKLRRRYYNARHDPVQMARLIEEANVALHTDQQALRNRASVAVG
jgi:hypothetical protein